MNNKIIKGTKKIEGLNLKLESIGKDLSDAIINESNKQKELLQKYKRMQQKIKSAERKLEDLKKTQQERKEKIQPNGEEELKEVQQRKEKKINKQNEKVRQNIIERRNKRLETITIKLENIDKKLEKLEYDREGCLQTLNVLNIELPKAEEKFANAKKTENVQELVDANNSLQHMKQKKVEEDKKLKKTNARLNMAMLIEMTLNDEMIETIKNYNEEAGKYGLKTIDIGETLNEQESFNHLKNIRKSQQTKYYKEKYVETIENNLNGENVGNNNLEAIKQLDDKQRREIELESQERVKEKRNKLLPIRAIKATGRGIAKAAGTVVGVTILVANAVGRNAKKLWQKIKEKTNKGLTGVNKLMLNGTTKLSEKLENDASVFEKRKEKLMSDIVSDVDESKAVKATEELNENKIVKEEKKEQNF